MATEVVYVSMSLAGLVTESSNPLKSARQAYDETTLTKNQEALREKEEKQYRQQGRQTKTGKPVPPD